MTELSVLEIAQKYWWLIAGPGAFAFGLGLLYLRSQFATKSDFERLADRVNTSLDGLEERLAGHARTTEQRLQSLENATEHLPDREAFHALSLEVTRQGATIRAIEQTQQATAAGVSRIEDHLLRGAK